MLTLPPPYTLVAPLKAGGMGQVVLARDTRDGREVAIKGFPRLRAILHTPAGDELLQRARRECDALRRLDRHDHVVRLIEVLDDDGLPLLVMEHVRGGSLQDYLDHHRPLAAGTVEALFTGVARGLAHAHAHGCVHRDIKPGNVLIDLHHGRMVPLVADFGLARLEEASARLTDTLDDRPMGTPGYMAPEQRQGLGSTDARTDVYALGCLAWELLSGERPGADHAAVRAGLERLAAEAREPGRARLARLARWCVAEQPDERPADARQVLAAWTGGPAGDATWDTVPPSGPTAPPPPPRPAPPPPPPGPPLPSPATARAPLLLASLALLVALLALVWTRLDRPTRCPGIDALPPLQVDEHLVRSMECLVAAQALTLTLALPPQDAFVAGRKWVEAEGYATRVGEERPTSDGGVAILRRGEAAVRIEAQPAGEGGALLILAAWADEPGFADPFHRIEQP